jgi:ferredoxin
MQGSIGEESMMSSDSETLTVELEQTALKSGASLIGIVSAHDIDASPKVWVGWSIQRYTKKTTDIMADAKSIVVMGYHVWDDMLELAVKKGEEWVYPGYFPLDVLVMAIEGFLEKKGYKTAHTSSISYKRLAQLAGFGNYGKNALIINPVYGPWLRFAAVVTNAELITTKPFMQDLCGDCEACVKACPADALTPYRVDDKKCLLGIHLSNEASFEQHQEWKKIEPSFTKNSHLMCTKCQRACTYGKEKH